MKKSYSGISLRWRLAGLAMLLGMIGSNSLLAQVSTYVFTQTTGTYTPIVGGVPLGTETNDDPSFGPLPIGFNYCYNGAIYNTFSIQNNGFITMGSTVPGSSYTNISLGAAANAIHGANFDTQSQNAGGELRYQTIGVAPNRTLVVQYKNYRGFGSTGDNLNFQIRLNETSNTVDVVYGSCVMGATSRQAEVGLKGNSNADFNNRSVITGTNVWAASTAGGTNAAKCDLQTATVPASGTTFSWAPPAGPAAPTTLTFSAITTNGMTVNWVDNSTDETNFFVFRSTDNINFTFTGTVPSLTTAATGGPYSQVQTGLSNGTLYYYRVVAASPAICSAALTGSQATVNGTLCGALTVGPTGAYTSLTAAFAAVVTNGVGCPVIFELQPAYVSTVETFPLVVPSLGANSVNTITVRPQAGATNLSITSADIAATLRFNGASYVTFDGRPGGAGVVSQLTIDNTTTTGSAVVFQNDANNDALRYLNIRGVTSSTTNGVVAFLNSSTAAGNSDNTIANCDLSDGLTTPNNMIYSNNTFANAFNERITVTNNTISDFYSATLASNGILINTAGNRNWTITGNSFFQSATRTATAANNHAYVNINSSAGYGYTVSNNFCGGSAANAGGTAATYNGAFASRMNVIWVTQGVGPNSTISGNTVRNFNFTTTSGATTLPGTFSGIVVQGAGNHDVSGNTVGSTTATGAITTFTSTSGGLTIGIASSCTGNVTMSSNSIGGINAFTSAGTVSASIAGINLTSGRNTVSGNTIGSTTVGASLATANNTSTTAGQLTGILSSSGFTNVFTNNVISNLSNFYAGTSTASQARGIATSSGINTITNNTVRRLGNAAPHGSVDAGASVIGISQTSTTTGLNSSVVQVISQNTIEAFGNGSATGNVNTIGIHFTGSTTGVHEISRNRIYQMGALTSGAGVLTGINLVGGTVNVFNNMVSIGSDDLGGTVVGGYEINGIKKNATTAMTFYYNSVNIHGTGVNTLTGNTAAFRRTATGADIIRNNIFANIRSNATTGGTHYSMNLNAVTTVTEDNNDFWGNGTGYQMGIVGTTVYPNFNAWKVGTLLDANSFNSNPLFVSATNLHINNPGVSVLESRAAVIAGITNDYDNDARPGPVGSVNGGGTIPDIGADEFDGFPILVDVGISAVAQPTSGCPTDTVRYFLKNYAGVTLNLATNPVTISAFTTGTNPQVFPNTTVNTGTIAPGATMSVVVSSTYSMATAGTYTFRGYTTLGADVLNGNDTLPTTNFVVSGGIATAARNTVCELDSALVTVNGRTLNGTVQWQSSPDNITFTNIPGATSPTYMAHPTPPQTFYRAVVCGLHNSVSDTINVTVVPPAVTVNDTVCGFGTANLSASGTATLNWYDQMTGGNLLTQGTTYSPTVATTTNYYVSNASGISNGLHTTTFAAGNGSSGNAFTVKALNTITITGFDGHISTTGGTNNWEIWYRPNDYLLTPGSHLSNAGWTQLGTAANVPNAGPGLPTPIPVALTLTIPAGSTYSFQIFCGGSVAYTNGTVLGALYNANTDLEVYQGHGGTAFAGMVNNPRVFNGRIRYSSGCESPRTMVTAFVTPAPAISVSGSAPTSCSGDPVTLTASSGNAGYSYDWTPATGLSSTTTAITDATPTVSTDYIVTATDTTLGCVAKDTIRVGAALKPIVTALATPDTICAGDSISLTSSAADITFQIGTGIVQNTATTYPSPYGNWFWGSRHQMLVLASELSALGLSAGNITSLAFDVVAVNTGQPLDNFEVKMANTNATAVTAFLSPAFTSVYFQPTYTPAVGIVPMVFSAPFFWDGTSNVVIETCHNNSSFTQNATVNQTVTPFTSTAYFFQDAAGVCVNPTVTASIAQRPNLYFTATKAYGYDWTPSISLATPTAAATFGTPTVTTDFMIAYTDSATGCVGMDTVNVFANPVPAINLGNDGFFCGTATTLDAGNPGAFYSWSTSDTTQTINISTNGTYDVAVTDTIGCTSTDTISITFTPFPVISLGPDVSFCAGSTATLDAGLTPATYLWTTTATTQTITVNAAGAYGVEVTDTFGCSGSDTVNVTVNALPNVGLTLNIDSLCSVSTTPVALTGGTPANGTYSGPGVSAGSITPSVAGIGSHTITYSFTDGNGCSNTATGTVVVYLCVGIEDAMNAFPLGLYPNPNSGVFTFTVPMDVNAEVLYEITDARGVVVLRANGEQPSGTYKQQVNFTDFSAGVYTLRVMVDGKAAQKRFVVQR